MARVQGTGNGVKKNAGIRLWWFVVPVCFAFIICLAVCWALVANVATPRSVYASDITRIDNNLNHLRDAATGLNSYASFQTNDTQRKLDDVDSRILGLNNSLIDTQETTARIKSDFSGVEEDLTQQYDAINSVQQQADTTDATVAAVNSTLGSVSSTISGMNNRVSALETSINDSSSGLKSKVDSITTTVNKILGIQIIPAISSASGSGTITLTIDSIQNMTSRLIAFRVEFLPTADVSKTSYINIDATLGDLYGTPPVTLNPGGSSSAAVAPDHTVYNVYWASAKYHLGSIAFTTDGTAIAAGSQTKTLAFTYTGSTGYEVVVSPLFESQVTSMGVTVSTW